MMQKQSQQNELCKNQDIQHTYSSIEIESFFQQSIQNINNCQNIIKKKNKLIVQQLDIIERKLKQIVPKSGYQKEILQLLNTIYTILQNNHTKNIIKFWIGIIYNILDFFQTNNNIQEEIKKQLNDMQSIFGIFIKNKNYKINRYFALLLLKLSEFSVYFDYIQDFFVFYLERTDKEFSGLVQNKYCLKILRNHNFMLQSLQINKIQNTEYIEEYIIANFNKRNIKFLQYVFMQDWQNKIQNNNRYNYINKNMNMFTFMYKFDKQEQKYILNIDIIYNILQQLQYIDDNDSEIHKWLSGIYFLILQQYYKIVQDGKRITIKKDIIQDNKIFEYIKNENIYYYEYFIRSIWIIDQQCSQQILEQLSYTIIENMRILNIQLQQIRHQILELNNSNDDVIKYTQKLQKLQQYSLYVIINNVKLFQRLFKNNAKKSIKNIFEQSKFVKQVDIEDYDLKYYIEQVSLTKKVVNAFCNIVQTQSFEQFFVNSQCILDTLNGCRIVDKYKMNDYFIEISNIYDKLLKIVYSNIYQVNELVESKDMNEQEQIENFFNIGEFYKKQTFNVQFQIKSIFNIIQKNEIILQLDQQSKNRKKIQLNQLYKQKLENLYKPIECYIIYPRKNCPSCYYGWTKDLYTQVKKKFFKLQNEEWFELQDTDEFLFQYSPPCHLYKKLSPKIFDANFGIFALYSQNNPTVYFSKDSKDKKCEDFFFAGQFIARMIMERQSNLMPKLNQVLLKILLKNKLCFEDLQQFDKEMYDKLFNILETDITQDDNLYFDYQFQKNGKYITKQLIQNGSKIRVLNYNKSHYVYKLTKYIIYKQFEEQIENFVKGFYNIIAYDRIKTFNLQEFNWLIFNNQKIDVDELVQKHYFDWQQYHYEQRDWVKQYLYQYSTETQQNQERLKGYLEFVTGSRKSLNEQINTLAINNVNRIQIYIRKENNGEILSDKSKWQISITKYKSEKDFKRKMDEKIDQVNRNSKLI